MRGPPESVEVSTSFKVPNTKGSFVGVLIISLLVLVANNGIPQVEVDSHKSKLVKYCMGQQGGALHQNADLKLHEDLDTLQGHICVLARGYFYICLFGSRKVDSLLSVFAFGLLLIS